MRFMKGMKVEVLSKKEVPSGTWHCAEIINGNGHRYTVRYDGASGEMTTERVSRRAIRSRPPLPVVLDNWFPGDVVEVFVNFSWQTATVLRVVQKKYILVRLLGSSLELKVGKFDIRVRQSWQDDEWVMIPKGPDKCEDCEHGENPIRNNQNSSSQMQNTVQRRNRHVKGERQPTNNKVNRHKLVIGSSKTLERGCYSQDEANVGAGHKLRKVEKEGRLYRLVAVAANPSIVDNRTKLSKLHTDWRKPNEVVGCCSADNLETKDNDNVTLSSVGSCSVGSNNLYELPHCISRFPTEEIDVECSATGPSGPMGDDEGNCFLPTKEELDAEIHKIELHAYRCTIEALHALGPLSWEQEALVTNLRLSLHISNDEHLMEVRNLISAETSIPLR